MKAQLPKRLGHKKLHEEHGKVVFRETYEEPYGNLTEWLLFGATKVPVVVFPLSQDGRVIVLRHFRYGAGDEVWELPGGGIERKQTPKQAVIDELKQEAEHEVGESDIVDISGSSGAGIWFDPASCKVRFLPFFANNCKPCGSTHSEEGEHLEWRYWSVEEWFSKLVSGEIRDAKSFAVSILALKAFDPVIRMQAAKGLQLVSS